MTCPHCHSGSICPQCGRHGFVQNRKPSGYVRFACRYCGHKWSENAKARGRPRIRASENGHEIEWGEASFSTEEERV